MIHVTLEHYEFIWAARVGFARHARAMQKALADRAGASRVSPVERLVRHVEGACGELAFAKARNLYWSGSVDTFHVGGDVGHIQVRTRSEQHYDLIVRDDDRDDDWFILVVGQAPDYQVVGAIRGRNAKREEYRRDHGGHGAAYFVPQHKLTPIYAPGEVAAA